MVHRSFALCQVIFCCLGSLFCSQAFVATAMAASREGEPSSANLVIIAPGSAYRQTNFVSDLPGVAFVQDPLLVNPWGIPSTAASPGPFWVANNGTSTSTLYRGDVGGSPIVKNPAMPFVSIPGGLPTGTVANFTSDFVLPGACASAPCVARFLFASITGNITGWNPNAPAAGSITAVIAASHSGHVYTGLAVGNNGVGNFLYAADFANGTIDVFDSTFALQPAASFPFSDPTIPTAVGNTYHPFNIQEIGGFLYVTYAKVDPMTGLDQEGVGNGYVRRFNFDGVRDLTFGIDNGPLNSPWGVTIAPASFGIFGGALLVGNFGEGNPSIHAFNPTTGAFLGTLQDESGNGIVIDELWALQFGNDGAGGNVDTLYFTAGIAEEEHGLFGSLKPTTASATSLIQFSTDNYAVNEGTGSIEITVTRDGDVSGGATVNYATYDQSQPDHALQKSDYEIALGTVTFAPGETSKSFILLLVNDAFDENDEVINLLLSNPTGAGTGLGSPNVAEMTIIDNDTGAPTTNPIDDTGFFIRQQYLDLLNREPEAAPLAFITSYINACGSDAACADARRGDIINAFFSSLEFRETGLDIYFAYQAAFGAGPLFGEFMRDLQLINRGVDFGEPGWQEQLRVNTDAFFADFVTRPAFRGRHGALTNAQYVDALYANLGITPTAEERQAAIDELNGATDSDAARARVLQRIVQNSTFPQTALNRADVTMAFYALLRRDFDQATFNTRLSELDASGDRKAMLATFATSAEFRERFGPAAATPPSGSPSPTPSRSLNISTRAHTGLDQNVMIGGFIITGSGNKELIVRGIGPALRARGIGDPLEDPTLSLHAADGTLVAANDNWRDDQESEIEATGIPPSDDQESAIVATLLPGAYTAILRGKGETTGVALVEVFDLDSSADSKLGNISTRALVQAQNNVMIGGFMLGGSGNSATVVIRGKGPALASEGITTPLADPTLQLFNDSGTALQSNDDWRDTQQLEMLTLGIPPSNENESGLVLTLAPGAYTAVMSGKDGTTGVGIVEVYNIP